MPSFGSESYRMGEALEAIRPMETEPPWIPPESIVGPDTPPEVYSLAPPKIKAGPGENDRSLNVNGARFLPSSVIVADRVDQTTTYISPGKLSIIIHPSAVTEPLPFLMRVHVKNNRTISNPMTFTFTP